MDPAEQLPVEIVEKIFGNLPGKALKECLLVSYGWNTLISSSPVCMEKLRLEIRETRWLDLTPSERISLVKSRKYRHVKIENYWFRLNQCKENFETFSEGNLKFLGLKSLSLNNIHVSILNAFQQCSALEQLRLTDMMTSGTEGTEYVFWRNLKSLKKLRIDRYCVDFVFGNNLSDCFSFELEELIIEDDVLHSPRRFKTDKAPPDFLRFLKAQSNSIKKLVIGSIGMDRAVIRAAYGIKSLKSFSAGSCHVDKYSPGQSIPVNDSVEKLRLPGTIGRHDQLLEILKASPNVKKLELGRMNGPMTAFIRKQLHQLQYLECRHWCKTRECRHLFETDFPELLESFEFISYSCDGFTYFPNFTRKVQKKCD